MGLVEGHSINAVKSVNNETSAVQSPTLERALVPFASEPAATW